MELLAKALALSLCGCVLALLIRRSNPEVSALVALLAAVAVLTLGTQLLSGVWELVSLAQQTAGLSQAIVAPVLKCVGLGFATRLGTDLC